MRRKGIFTLSKSIVPFLKGLFYIQAYLLSKVRTYILYSKPFENHKLLRNDDINSNFIMRKKNHFQNLKNIMSESFRSNEYRD